MSSDTKLHVVGSNGSVTSKPCDDKKYEGERFISITQGENKVTYVTNSETNVLKEVNKK